MSWMPADSRSRMRATISGVVPRKYDCWRFSNVRCVPITRSKTGRCSENALSRSVVSTRWVKLR